MGDHDVGGPLSSIADPNNNNLPPQSQVQAVNLAGSGGSTGPDEAGDQVGIIIAEQQNEQNNDGVTRTKVTRKQLGIKRACSECRQQKLRCDVVKDPFTTCSRCRRLQLVCKIDTSFKRIEKRRAKNERRQLAEEASRTELPTTAGSPFYELAVSVDRDTIMTQTVSNVGTRSYPTVPMQSTELQQVHNSSSSQWPETPGSNHMPTHPVRTQFGSNISVNSTLSTAAGMTRKLDGVLLTANEVQALFQLYFKHYHPFLPFLQPSKSPDYYFNSSRLLFWTIISIASRRYISDLTLLPSLSTSVPRLLWSVLQGVPQSYHDVKAICLLCTWPFPLNSSSCDPTFMLSGTMMHLAMQIGLHRPSQAQDFSKVTLKLHHDELQDRITTWITCRIVAQSVATGYGQPPTIFDGIPDHSVSRLPDNYVSSELTCRLRIEKLADRITRELYSMTDTKSTFNPSQHFVMINIVDRELTQLESELITPNPSSFLLLYLRCAHLHLHLYTFFDSIASQNFIASLLTLYKSCEALLTMVLSSNDNILSYCPNYVFQMTLASGFTLLKLLRSPMVEYIDYSECKALFNSNIAAVRKISVSNNDLPGRLAEVLAQLMARANEAAQNRLPNTKNDWGCQQLKVRGRMSMSVMFDGLWEWRNGFETDSVRGLTTSSTEISSVQVGESPAQAAHDNESASAIAANQDFDLDNMVFDDFYPVNWLIENIPEIPLSSLPDAVAA